MSTITSHGQIDKHKESSFKRKVVIVIDPGHGGEDVGKPKRHTKSHFKNEADLNLDIALRVGGYFEERVGNVQIYYTRKTDRTISLNERVEFANRVKADYFISIHCNSLKDRNYKGTQVHIQSKTFPTTYGLASSINKELLKTGRKSRGIIDHDDRGHNLQVIQYTEMPGVLIECGFMSNSEEEIFLNSGKGQTYIASALYRGIRNFENLKVKPAPDKRYPYYRVQIGTTPNKNEITYKKYRKLNMQIDAVKENGKYSLYVGREYEKRYIDKLLATVKKRGFKDAFIKTFKKPVPQKITPKPKVEAPKKIEKDSTVVASKDTTSTPSNNKEEELHFYRIQIMSSDRKLDINKREFTNLGEAVYLFYDENSTNPYKYQVLVGKYYAKSKAVEVKEKVRKKGFPDAFIVTVKQSEARKSQDRYIPKNN
ncbi:N-acetylmuramoyl-L-alanine amidase [Flammeovirga yaeyamensis]|uniref:N-acetylmuramoyl-L-alanine amidase n=1 Tax=Flammeovirga yaeyamensis TaxID=367791 RepID=A0AAX1N0V0_9BACT|nr:N-acetylmuramoyl-L-alanine amidase [Flammeovirga yaeyamensis]MBB3698543.1 N-acetylmuramoyl-L-alanine amidase [Flammeovirga yaeyamensis]NMF34108.1 N-acetylmuramoyl-L-alanine amidase [Flammeovirga yaeyamensis]QWG01095.1 N-acetylmuramoyl-L-alanine amidase [Flammeovirga yaeyamensis]